MFGNLIALRRIIGPVVAAVCLFVCAVAQADGVRSDGVWSDGVRADGVRAAQVTVTIGNFVFSPASVTLHKGDSTIFVNGDDTVHSVQSDDGTFHSAGLDTGDKVSFTFDHPGTFTYHCGLHPFMQGKIVVE